jgi:hypothetical protein
MFNRKKSKVDGRSTEENAASLGRPTTINNIPQNGDSVNQVSLNENNRSKRERL